MSGPSAQSQPASPPLAASGCAAADALHAVESATDLPAVAFSVEGVPMIGAFALNRDEHDRRARLGVGAVTSVALLHGLWMLPPGGLVPQEALPDIKVQRLRAAPHAAAETDAGFERLYAPPGTLRAVGLTSGNVESVVNRLARVPPIFQRFALVPAPGQSVPLPIECMAREWGVGIILLRRGSSPRVLVPAAEATTGVPGVFRWWMAELAYESYISTARHRPDSLPAR